MTLLLGKTPVRHDDRTLKLAAYAPSSGFVFPKSKSWAPDVPSFPMLANDRFGDCVFAGAYHQIQLWLDADGVDVVPAEADTLQAYAEVTGFNPADPSTDRGANLLDALNFWRKTGMPWTVNGTPMRHEIAGYAKIEHTNHAEAKLAIAEFGGAYLGVNLPLAAQAQFGSGKHWTVGRGPNSVPGSWGGHCLAPGTRVLTEDLRWIPIEDVLVGEALIGFDEFNGSNQKRNYRRSVVEGREILTLPCYDLTFEDGTTVRASEDHMWLIDAGNGTEWRRTDELRALANERGTQVLKPLEVWDEDTSRDAGYLAAAFDGEGWLGTGGVGRGIHRLGFAQKGNEMLERVRGALKERGFDFADNLKTGTGFTDKEITEIGLSGRTGMLRLLGSIRPHRLLSKFNPDSLGTMYSGRTRLVEKKFVGESPTIALQTSTKTFLAEGMASHNCVLAVGYNATTVALVTWGKIQFATYGWLDAYADEMYAILSTDWTGEDQEAPSQVDFAQLKTDIGTFR